MLNGVEISGLCNPQFKAVQEVIIISFMVVYGQIFPLNMTPGR